MKLEVELNAYEFDMITTLLMNDINRFNKDNEGRDKDDMMRDFNNDAMKERYDVIRRLRRAARAAGYDD